MKKVIATLVLLGLTWTVASAEQFKIYYPNGFEEKIKAKTIHDDALKLALFDILSSFHQTTPNGNDTLVSSCSTRNCYQHTPLGYKNARINLFGLLDLKKDDRGYFLRDVYCQQDFVRTDVGPMKIPDNTVVNCEHSWPQSKFTGSFPEEMQKSDLHHLFVTGSQANSTRGNNPFGEINGQVVNATNCTASIFGKTVDTETHQNIIVFQPPAEHHGNVARALFYFSVRYKLPIGLMQEETLRRWHREDPVTSEDLARNDQIKSLQGNRNPFVDFPEMVDLISDF